ncbi:hypothetical protein L6164_025537 [Bauhinia variegata]|uniref:Uncharacterized protein n=1 Tax=Bauhinia variegata TaxID=167791 RepID=A0ACB9M2A1_BAUVA|nr:hypothetical protein L6164_025537 [Bauhinia variegata]
MSATSIPVTTYLGNLVKYLPTGTVFVYQTLNAAATDSGHCDPLNRYLSSFLFGICLFVCFLGSFTDSYTDQNGQRRYVLVTPWDLVPAPTATHNISNFGPGDVFHAFISTAVFAVLGLMDTNTVLCFYPEYESTKRTLLQLLPPVALAIPCVACSCFPYNRHGLGYPPTATSTSDTNNVELTKNDSAPPPPSATSSSTPPV